MWDEILNKLHITQEQFDKLVGLYGRYQGKNVNGGPIVIPDDPMAPYMGEDLPDELLPWNVPNDPATNMPMTLGQSLKKLNWLTQEEADALDAAMRP
ncbi:MAG TPA: hypothetical protein VII06_00400 [Chloroflexota bacterium]|jgi:hypothetical protein